MDILLITIDQWRGDSLSCDGHPVARTPNIDRLAARGVRFARHYAQAAPCGPSRASILTGTYAHVHRSVGNGTPLDARFTNLALELRSAGLDPTLFGYTDTTVDVRTVDDPDDPRLRTYEGVLPGFTVEVNLPEHLEAWGEWLRGHGYDVPVGEVPDTMYRVGADGATPYAAEHSEAAFLTERYVEWLDRQHGDTALFSHLTYIRPHPPFMAPAPWHELIDPDDVPMPVRHDTPEADGAQHPMVAGALASGIASAPVDDGELRQFRATYWGMLGEVDHQLGILLDHLDRTGRASDTLVILTADHGEQLGDHWLTEKLGFFDSSYHIPLIIAGPPVATAAAGTVVHEFTENIDLMPTILDLSGLPVPNQCQGATLRTFLAGGTPDVWRDAVHWEWDFRSVGSRDLERLTGLRLNECNLSVIRDQHGKYVHFAGMPPAFYDLDTDPGELHNLAGDADTDPAVATRMLDYASRMLSWRLRTDDETLATTMVTPFGVISRQDPLRG